MNRTSRNALGCTIMLLAIGCSSSSTTGAPSKGRGTAACNTWQTAICDWATKCSATGAAMCSEQANSVECVSDDKARMCATAIAATPCTALPAGCGILDLADPVPAQKACQRYIDTVCSANMRCDSTTTADACEQTVKASLDCSKVNSVKASFEQCIAEVTALSCDAKELPASCKSVLVSIQ